MKTQNQRILAYLKKGHGITPYGALRMFGSLRLSGRIYDLKREGHRIEKQWVKRNGKHWARYVMARSA
jgi:hypothetical protein